MTLNRNRDESLPYAYVRDFEVGTNRSTFISLTPDYQPDKVVTAMGVEAHVDLDDNGEVVAVSVLWGPN